MIGRGSLFIIAAPSGAGKTSLVKRLIEQMEAILVSISYTTRPIRPAEVDGENYFFISIEAFKTKIKQNHFLEYADVFGNYYGTSRAWVEEKLAAGIDVILEIDWQGAQQVRKQSQPVCSIFILPPSLTALQQRLQARAQDESDVIAKRMANAQQEMSHYSEFDYVIINDEFSHALNQLQTIIQAERLRTAKQQFKYYKLLAELVGNQ